MTNELKVGDKVRITNFQELFNHDIEYLISSNGIATVSDIDVHPCTDCPDNQFITIFVTEIEGVIFGLNDFKIIDQ